MSKQQAASLNPEEMIEGGGLIDDVDVVFESCMFEMFDYNGQVVPAIPTLKVEMSNADLEENMLQYYSMGSAQDWMPSEDGSQLLAVGSATQLRKSTNGAFFLSALISAGFPAEDLGDDISNINGLQAHVIQMPAPTRKGLKPSKKEQEREEKYGPKTILVVSEVIAMPGEKKKPAAGKKTGGKKPAAGSKKKATGGKKEASGDVAEKATAVVLAILEAEGTIEKKKLPTTIFKHELTKKDPDKNAITQNHQEVAENFQLHRETVEFMHKT